MNNTTGLQPAGGRSPEPLVDRLELLGSLFSLGSHFSGTSRPVAPDPHLSQPATSPHVSRDEFSSAADDPSSPIDFTNNFHRGDSFRLAHFGELRNYRAPRCFPLESCVRYPYPRELAGAAYAGDIHHHNRYYSRSNRVPDAMPERNLDVPFTPDISSAHLSTVQIGDQLCLQAAVWLGNRHHVCNYALDPPSGVVTFVVTRRWSAPGKPMMVGGRSMRFPRQYNWDLGKVVDSGEKTSTWICRWPKVGEQLVGGEMERVVDVVVQEGDYWFGLGNEGVRAVDKGKCKAVG